MLGRRNSRKKAIFRQDDGAWKRQKLQNVDRDGNQPKDSRNGGNRPPEDARNQRSHFGKAQKGQSSVSRLDS